MKRISICRRRLRRLLLLLLLTCLLLLSPVLTPMTERVTSAWHAMTAARPRTSQFGTLDLGELVLAVQVLLLLACRAQIIVGTSLALVAVADDWSIAAVADHTRMQHLGLIARLLAAAHVLAMRMGVRVWMRMRMGMRVRMRMWMGMGVRMRMWMRVRVRVRMGVVVMMMTVAFIIRDLLSHHIHSKYVVIVRSARVRAAHFQRRL